MDIYSLVAGMPREWSRQQPMSAQDEQRYYERARFPRLPRGRAASMATLVGAVLVLLVGGYMF